MRPFAVIFCITICIILSEGGPRLNPVVLGKDFVGTFEIRGTVQSGNIAHLRYFMPGLTSNINTDEHHLPLDILLIQLLKYHDMKC